MRLLLDEMYPPTLADGLRTAGIDTVTRTAGIDTVTVSELGFAGRSDSDVLAAATHDDRVLLSENVADFARICAERLLAGEHHPGVLIALASRFSRRPAGIPRLIDAVQTVADQQLDDRVVYLAVPDA